jgi:hypothetical protein
LVGFVPFTAGPNVGTSCTATPAPTAGPTKAPTDMPTDAPTDEPTAAPTDAPTHQPTMHPCDSVNFCDESSTQCEKGASGSAYTCACLEGFIADTTSSTSCTATATPTADPTSTPTSTPTWEPTKAAAGATYWRISNAQPVGSTFCLNAIKLYTDVDCTSEVSSTGTWTSSGEWSTGPASGIDARAYSCDVNSDCSNSGYFCSSGTNVAAGLARTAWIQIDYAAPIAIKCVRAWYVSGHNPNAGWSSSQMVLEAQVQGSWQDVSELTPACDTAGSCSDGSGSWGRTMLVMDQSQLGAAAPLDDSRFWRIKVSGLQV